MVELLQNEHLVEAFREPRRGLLRERVRRAHLPEAVGRQLDAALLQHAQRLARISRRHPARHDSEARRGTVLHHRVEHCQRGLGVEVVRDGAQPLVDLAVRLVGAAREDDPLGIALEALGRHGARVGGIGHVEERGRVVDARGGPHDDGRAVALGQVEGGVHHGEALVGRGRIQHGHLREGGEAARVLLGLRRDGARVVGHEQHEAALHAHVVQAHERVGRHVEPHLLAGEQAARAGVGGAGQQFERRLLVGGPLHVHASRGAGRVKLRHRLDELGRRRAGVARRHAHARLERRVRERLVSHQKFLRHMRLACFGTRWPLPGQQRKECAANYPYKCFT